MTTAIVCLARPSSALAPHLQLARVFRVETIAFAQSLKLGIAMPHDLMSRGRIGGTAEVATQASDEKHGITQLSGLRQSFFFA